MAEDRTALNRATYDRIAGLYVQNQDEQIRRSGSGGRWFGDLEAELVARLPARSVVGDLGCGPGRDAARFAERGLRVLGVDLSAGMLAQAHQRLPGRLVQADLRALPLADGTLDGIWCSAALLHVPDDDTPTVLGEIGRVLRPGGWLALVTALGEGSRLEAVEYAPGQRRWFVYRSADRLRRQLLDAGLASEIETEVPSRRQWLTVLARLVRPLSDRRAEAILRP